MSAVQADLERHAAALLRALERREGERLVSFAIFGSVARGEAAPGSDLDLLIVFESLPRPRVERFRHFYDAREETRVDGGPLLAGGQPFDWSPVLRTRAEAGYRSPLYLDLVEDARILFDRGDFFAGVLAGLRERMRELGSRRVRLADGSWCWVLKPDRKPGEVVEL